MPYYMSQILANLFFSKRQITRNKVNKLCYILKKIPKCGLEFLPLFGGKLPCGWPFLPWEQRVFLSYLYTVHFVNLFVLVILTISARNSPLLLHSYSSDIFD